MLCKDNDITHRLNAVRTPRANGQVERLNRTVLSMLTTMTEKDQDWDDKLYDIQWSLNTMKSSITGRSPQELLFNFTPRDALQNKLLLALHEDQPVTEEEIKGRRHLSALRINNNRAQMKERFNAKKRKPRQFEIGDLVLAENEQPSIGQSRKLEPRFKGPFMVTKVLGKDRYVVEDLPKSRRTKRHYSSVHASDKLKHFCELLEEPFNECEQGEDDDDDGYEVVEDDPQ